MNKNTYHFSNLRLHVSPQTRVSSLYHTPGFTSLRECEQFCASIGFGYTIFFVNEKGEFINSKKY